MNTYIVPSLCIANSVQTVIDFSGAETVVFLFLQGEKQEREESLFLRAWSCLRLRDSQQAKMLGFIECLLSVHCSGCDFFPFS